MRDLLEDADLELIEHVDDDAVHLKKAYKLFKGAMRELLECRHLDTPVIKAMRQVYEVEDVLWQYTKK